MKRLNVLERSGQIIALPLVLTCCMQVAATEKEVAQEHKVIGMPAAWELGLTGKGVAVGVIDVGFHSEDPSLVRSHLVPGKDVLERGWEWPEVGGEADVKLYEDHGLSVSAVIVANGGGLRGIAPGVRLHQELLSPMRLDREPTDAETAARHLTSMSRFLNMPGGMLIINHSYNQDGVDTISELSEAWQQMDAEELALWGALTRRGVLQVFAAGNELKPQAGVYANLPYFDPSLESHWLSVVDSRDNKTGTPFSNDCGASKYWCLAAPGVLKGARLDQAADNVSFQRAQIEGTSFATPVVTGAAALLKERFSYMSMEQIREVLLTTATPLDDSGVSTKTGWGRLNVAKALGGPGQLLGEFRANLAKGQSDTWSNDISDQALAQREREERNELASENQGLGGMEAHISAIDHRRYQGSLVKTGEGTLTLSGNSTYRGSTLVEQGRLHVQGNITSAVQVRQGATLAGLGKVGAVSVAKGGRLDNTLGAGKALRVDGALELAPEALLVTSVSSGALVVGGKATVDKARLLIVDQPRGRSWQTPAGQSLLDDTQVLLRAQGAVVGRFDQVKTPALFLDALPMYGQNDVGIQWRRNDKAFASAAITTNEQAVAGALERVGPGHAVYEDMLVSTSLLSAKHKLETLTAEGYPALQSALMGEAQALGNVLGTRARAVEGGASTGAWFQLRNGTASAYDEEYADWNDNVSGILLGVDGQLDNGMTVGVVAGQSRSKLKVGDINHSRADTDTYSLGSYMSTQLDGYRLMAGANYNWHQSDVTRTLRPLDKGYRHRASLDSQSFNLFGEVAYPFQAGRVMLEPFALLGYTRASTAAFTEKGSAAAVAGAADARERVASTLGLRASSAMNIVYGYPVAFYTQLGWQHRFGELEASRSLHFANTPGRFTMASAGQDRDALIGEAGVGVETPIGMNMDFSLSASTEGRESGKLTLGWAF